MFQTIARLRAVTFAIGAIAATLNSAHANEYIPPEAAKALVKHYFPDAPIMVAVAKCESGLEHVQPDGKLTRSSANAVGIMQLHLPAHRKEAAKDGKDLTNIADNLEYARKLYDEQGLRPWKSSKHCWSKRLADNVDERARKRHGHDNDS